MHAHDPNVDKASERRIWVALLITGGFMLIEVGGGLLSGSLALLADAGHMLTDTAALALAWVAFRVADKPADEKRTFGYHRFQILAAFVNGLTLVGIVGWIVIEALRRLLHPIEVLGAPMLAIAVLGLVVNLGVYALLHGADSKNLNVRGAAIHVLGDLLGSVAAITAAGIILWTGWTPADPLLSLLVAILILRSAWSLLRKSGHILLEGMPEWLDTAAMRARLVDAVPELLDIHHVHVWSLNPRMLLLTMHADVRPGLDQPRALREMKRILEHEFGISHSTIEFDVGECADE